jgi:DNA-binding GntR family transcriptional regulator
MESLRNAADTGDACAFAHHDKLLHDHILAAAGNARARAIVGALRESTRLLGATTERTLFEIDAEHQPVIAAITTNRPAVAIDAMRRHLTSTGRLLVTQAVRDQDCDLDPGAIWANAVGGHAESSLA